jgi:hypothetical protein
LAIVEVKASADLDLAREALPPGQPASGLRRCLAYSVPLRLFRNIRAFRINSDQSVKIALT